MTLVSMSQRMKWTNHVVSQSAEAAQLLILHDKHQSLASLLFYDRYKDINVQKAQLISKM